MSEPTPCEHDPKYIVTAARWIDEYNFEMIRLPKPCAQCGLIQVTTPHIHVDAGCPKARHA